MIEWSPPDEDLMQLFGRLKQTIKDDCVQKEALRQRLAANETNEDWSKQLVQQLRQELSESRNCIDGQHKAINELRSLKDVNKDLNDQICRLNIRLKTSEDMSKQLVETIQNDLNDKMNDLKKQLEAKDKELDSLRVTIGCKELATNESRRALMDEKTKCEQNIAEIQEMYENKIKSLYKEFDHKMEKCLKANDDKIIDIKANCLMTVERTKEEYEKQLQKYQSDNKELNEKYSHLRLEAEARKMSNCFVGNTSNNTLQSKRKSNTSGSNSKANTSGRPKLSIRVLDSDDESSEAPAVQLVPYKRKKLMKPNDSYLDFLKEQN